MAVVHILGSANPVETRKSKSVAQKNTIDVTIEGTVAGLEALDPTTKVPAGYIIDSSNLSEHGDGFGTLTIHCVTYESGSSFSAARSTFRVDMMETSIDLIAHPKLSGVTDICAKWLATDLADRGPDESGKFYYRAKPEEGKEKGELIEITDQASIDFCSAYSSGITTYLRFDPVIEQIDIWKNPPGLNRSGDTTSFSGGSPTFSSDVGKWSPPPITLSGYPTENWFKSKDSWIENANKTWTRTQVWTYSPDGSTGTHSWIYANA